VSPGRNQPPIEGFPPPTRITIVGTGTNLDGLDDVTLGQAVDVHIKGTVIVAGRELVGEDESRPVVKIRADTVSVS
jgi:hypothetical protein